MNLEMCSGFDVCSSFGITEYAMTIWINIYAAPAEVLEKKGDTLVEGSADTLKTVGPDEIFWLHNGLTISNLRELVLILINLDKKTFDHHVTQTKNDFAIWVRDVFKDKALADKIETISDKKLMAEQIQKALILKEEGSLRKFKVFLPTEKLGELEKYIDKELAKGAPQKELRAWLIKNHWPENVVDLLFEFREAIKIRNIASLQNLERHYNHLRNLSEYLAKCMMEGYTLEEVEHYLKKHGWDDMLIGALVYDVFKPHKDLKKLREFIVHGIAKGKSIRELSDFLKSIKWDEYILEYAIYGAENQGDDIEQMLNYLQDFKFEDKKKITRFLKQIHWGEEMIDELLHRKEEQDVINLMRKSFGIPFGLKNYKVKTSVKIIDQDTVELEGRSGKKILLALERSASYRKIAWRDYADKSLKVLFDPEDLYYYPGDKIHALSHKLRSRLKTVLYANPRLPLIIPRKTGFLLRPIIRAEKCVVCGQEFLIREMEKVERWDKARVHHISRWVCQADADKVKNLFPQKIMID